MFSHENYPLVSVVILNWNGGDYLRMCVKSVIETDYPKNLLEVAVVDNGSTDGSARLAKKKYPQIKLIENGSNLGFCVGNNIGIKYASGNLIILLNNDTCVEKSWVKEIVKVATNPHVGIIGCKLYYANTNIIQSVGFQLHPSGCTLSIGVLQVDQGQFDEIKDVDYVSGAALAVKRSVIDEIGLLDPEFYAYYEDVDWCQRAKKVGYRVVIAPRAIVHHFGSISWRKRSLKHVYLCERNRLYFIMKHHTGLKLFKSLTLHDLEFTVQKIVELLACKTVTQIEKLSPAIAKNRSKHSRIIEIITTILGAKLLAYLLIPLLIFKTKKGRLKWN